MEEIDIGQMLGYFKSKIIYILFAMSIAFCLASIYVNRFRVPEYTSYTTILLNKTNESESINSADLTLGKSLVSTYGEIIKSKKVLREVIDNLALDLDYSSLASKVSVSSVTDTSIIKISVTDEDSEAAAHIANKIAEVFSQDIVEIYNIENISIIDVAEVSTSPSSTSSIKIIGLSIIAGAFIAIAVVFILFYFDTTIKNEEDIERITGLPVIGVVPISREKIKGSAHRKYYEEQARKHKSQEILPIEREVRKIEVTEEPIQNKDIEDEMDVVNVPILKKIENQVEVEIEKKDVDTELGITKTLQNVAETLKSVERENKPNHKSTNYNYKKNNQKRNNNRK